MARILASIMRQFLLGIGAVVFISSATALAGTQSVQRSFAAQITHSIQGEDRVREFLRTYLGNPVSDFEQEVPTSYVVAFADLNGDSTKELIIYVEGRGWCGSGGCKMLILTPVGPSYRVVGDTSITRPPIRVLTTRTNGWRDLAVWVQGGGIQPGYEARLPFDGRHYPTNPSVPPAMPAGGNARGDVLISRTAEGKPLYS